MKTKHLILSGTVIMMATALSLTSCRKEKDNDKDTSGAEDNSLADKSFEDMAQISNEAANGSVTNFKNFPYDGLLSTCASVTHDTALNKIVVDFGIANCLCNDGRYRRGKIFISYNNASKPEPYTYWDSLTQITITTTDPSSQANTYFVGPDQNTMHQIIGTKTVTNNGHNAAGHMNWSVVVNGQVIKANNQGTVSWSSTRNREWLSGEGTPSWMDDSYGVTGTASGTSANGTPFNVTITGQLIRKISCPKHFVAGTFDFTPGTKPVRHVDFSPPNNGQCDNIATVTINSNTYTVYMK